MTDIPYSFVPGTKAKAQEVNANFIALSNAIDSNQSSADSRASAMEADISALQAKKYVDFNVLTNSVLEAPNGVAEYLLNILTVKSGLKVLIPNGISQTNGALQNIEYTVTEDIIADVSGLSDGSKMLFLNSDGTLLIIDKSCYCVSDAPTFTPTSSSFLWYSHSTNQINKYNMNSSQWEPKATVFLADFNVSSGEIVSLNCVSAVELYKYSDKREIMNYSNLSNKFLSVALSVSGSTYVAPADGILYWYGIASGNNCYLMMNNDNANYQSKYLTGIINTSMCCWIPVSKGDVVHVYYDKIKDPMILKFIYAKGEV